MTATFSCKFLSRFTINSFSSLTYLQNRNMQIPKRKSFQTFSSEKEYLQYLAKKRNKRKPQKTVKNVQLSEKDKKALSQPKNSFKANLPESLLKLRFKKLRDMPGNVLNRMVTDVDASIERPHRHLCLLTSSALIKEALKLNFVKNIYFDRLHKLQEFPPTMLEKVRLTHVPDRLLKFLPTNCQDGVFAISAVQEVSSRKKILNIRRKEDRQNKRNLLSMTIVCEGMTDAVEVGNVLKYAEKSGCEQVFVMDSCTDVWRTAVLEVSEGAHFKISILHDQSWETVTGLDFGENLHVVHQGDAGKSELSLEDFVSRKELNKYGRSTRVMEMLEKESSHGTITRNEEFNFKIPFRSCQDVNLLAPSTLIIGNFGLDAFQFAANKKFKNCFALKPTNDVSSSSLSGHLKYILEEANKQQQK